MKFFLCVSAIFFLMVINVSAQNERYAYTKKINIRLGAQSCFQSGNKYEGVFSSDRQSVQGQAFMGYHFGESEGGASYLGVWASLGDLNKGSITEILKENNLNLPAAYNGSKGSFWELQMGVILDEWFSLSAGAGSMHFLITNGSSVNRNYYIANGGLIFGRGLLNLVMNHSLLFGGDLQKPALRLGAGLLLNLKIFNGKKR